ncbi:MAG TPA: alpha/beta hydrolase [Anaerolineales bacterium]|jgi:acetyl esterase/lipase
MNLTWQAEEYLRVSRMLTKIAWANERRSEVVEKKLAFGAHPQQFLVLHYRRPPVSPDPPLIFFLHGGGWGHGNPSMFRFIGRFFAEAGYPVILGGYRLAPHDKFPHQLDDAYDGLKAGLRLAAARGLRTDSVILAGQSAGAQLASLMLLDRDRLQAHGFTQDSFAGLLLVSGLLNFAYCQTEKDRQMLHNYLGDPAHWPNADPIRFVRGDERVPALCIHGERDILVDSANSTSFISKLNHNGEIYLVPDAYHTDVTSMFLDHLPATQIMLQWLARVVAEALNHEAPTLHS